MAINWDATVEEYEAAHPAHRWIDHKDRLGIADSCPCCPDHKPEDIKAGIDALIEDFMEPKF
jgi:hypothetical protein